MQCSDCHVLFPTGHHLGWHKRTGCPSKTDKTLVISFISCKEHFFIFIFTYLIDLCNNSSSRI